MLDAFGGCVAAPKVAAQLESLKFTPGGFFFDDAYARECMQTLRREGQAVEKLRASSRSRRRRRST